VNNWLYKYIHNVFSGFNAGLVAYQSWIDTVKLLAVSHPNYV